MTNEELLSVAEIVERLVARFHKQAADHEAKMFEHRAAFGARTKADAETIDRLHTERDALRAEVTDLRRVFDMVHGSLGIRQGDHIGHAIDRLKSDKLELFNARQRIMAELAVVKDEWDTLRTERDGLLTQVQDMRAERERLRSENQIMRNDAEDGYAEAIKVLGDPIALSKERDALRAEVAALQERLRASIARGDLAQMKVAALKSQTPKHPVRVGEWVRRTTAGSVAPIGKVGLVLVVWSDAYEVQLRNGFSTLWSFDDCTPCDPPTEATHDTPAGKAAAESVVEVVRTEPDEIKVGDVVEVFRDSSGNTLKTDVGIIGKVLKLYSDSIDGERLVMLDPESQNRQSEGGCHYALCDVRKVTT